MREPPATHELSPTVTWWIVGTGVIAAIAVLLYGFVVAIPGVDGSQQLERNGIRTATVAIAAAIGAGVSLIISARTHVHALAEAARLQERHRQDRDDAEQRQRADLIAAEQRQRAQLTSEHARADRLHLTQLFDSAASKLGAEDDATRTAAVLILERLYADAATLLAGDDANRQQRDSLQRSITETICGYVRERSVAHSAKWHADHHPDQDLSTGLHESYRSPPSIRTALSVLGRLAARADAKTTIDLTASHLAHINCHGTFHGAVTLSHAKLSDASFWGATINGNASFGGATINGNAWFGGATIHGDASFTDATINGNASFDKATIHGDALFIETAIHGSVSFRGAMITGVAWFGRAAVDRDASFDKATIHGDAWFGRATITGNARFGRATITGNVSFDEATITGNVSFDEATIHGNASMSRASIIGNAKFDEATITGDALLTRATIHGDASFDRATIHGDAWFDEATIHGNASFDRAIVARHAWFSRATIRGDASFQDATVGSRRSAVVWVSLAANWHGRVRGLASVAVPALTTIVDVAGASFADPGDNPHTWT